MKKVTIIILNWNGWQDTIECLESITKLPQHQSRLSGTVRGFASDFCEKPPRRFGGGGSQITNYKLQIIIVDNGSTDDSVEKIKNYIIKTGSSEKTRSLMVLENQENLGFAEGNNVGIRYAFKEGADFIFLLNNDTLVDKNLIDRLYQLMEKDKTIGIAGPKIYFASGFEFHKNRYNKKELGKVIWYAGGIIDWQNVYCFHRGVDEVDKGQYQRTEETDFVSGCGMMIRKKVFDKVGYFDPKYFLYLEDVDFCIRAEKVGFKIVYTPKAFLWHKNAASSEKPGSKIHQYYQTRNRLCFGLKYAPLRPKLALLRESLGFLIKNKVKQKAVLDFYLGRLGYAKIN